MLVTALTSVIAIAHDARGEIDSAGQNSSKMTTSWNLSFLFKDKEEATSEFNRLRLKTQEINRTFRPEFERLTGPILLDYIQQEKLFAENFSVVSAYAQNSLNVNDKFFEEFVSDVQNYPPNTPRPTPSLRLS
jgi:oligoendopeptidase F